MAKLSFLDDGFCQSESTEGELRCRYMMETIEDLERGLDILKRDAERLGIDWNRLPEGPTVYYAGDGEIKGSPHDAREVADEQSRRMGWREVYRNLARKENP